MLEFIMMSAALAAAPVAAPSLTVDQETALRCSASFAIVAAEQTRGTAWAATFPPLQQRGKEYFVRTGARLMDETGMTRDAVQELARRQALMLRSDMAHRRDPEGIFTATMPLCLGLLETAVPADARNVP